MPSFKLQQELLDVLKIDFTKDIISRARSNSIDVPLTYVCKTFEAIETNNKERPFSLVNKNEIEKIFSFVQKRELQEAA